MVGFAEVFVAVRDVYKVFPDLIELSIGHAYLGMCILECGDLQAFLGI